MTISYALRLVCVSLAAFAVIFAVTGAAVACLTGAAIRMAERMRATAAAQMVLMLRLMPAALAAVLVLTVCVPSYARFEQRAEMEEAGLLCVALALLSVTLLSGAFLRAMRAWRRTAPAQTTLALVGILRPRIVVSETAREHLSAAELAAALRHERSHAESHDNLKRLLILLAPGPFPGFAALETAWKRLAEYAADDRAAAGDPQRSLSLAAALVRIAKLGPVAGHPLSTSFLAAGNDLESRVERLLNPEMRPKFGIVRVAFGTLGAVLIAGIAHPGTPAAVHGLLERLLH